MTTLLFVSAVTVASAYTIPTVTLKNAAKPGLTFPITGLGTGGYGHDIKVGYGGYPECWSDSAGCGAWTRNTTTAYLKLAASLSSTQVRIDNANTYDDVDNIGLALADSGLPRDQIFLLTKTGSGQAMGYNDSITQFNDLIKAGGYTYVDAVLIHWPTSSAPSTEPSCQTQNPSYNAKDCRLATWRAYVDIFNSGRALSIGVSNYNSVSAARARPQAPPPSKDLTK